MDRTYYGYISDEALMSLDSMEGIQQLPSIHVRKPPAAPVWPGYALAGGVAALAYGAHLLPFAPFQVGEGANARHPLSAATLAILAGVMARNLLPLPTAGVGAAKTVARTVIPLTVVLTGAGLDLRRLAGVGGGSLVVVVVCIVVSTLAAVWVGARFKVWPKTAMLIGAGTAICGTSAIVAVAPVIEAADQDLLLSIGAINVLGLALMFALPAFGSALGMKDDWFGVWAGTTIHAVPQVVAAGFAYSASAGALATLVKLVRVTFLAPYLFVAGLVYAKGKAGGIQYHRLVPNFVWGFLALAVLNTMGLFPVLQFRFGSAPLSGALTYLGEWLLTLSMAAMGLEVNVRFFAKVGGPALLTGLVAMAVLCGVSLVLIRVLI